jgi:hypothetical protein
MPFRCLTDDIEPVEFGNHIRNNRFALGFGEMRDFVINRRSETCGTRFIVGWMNRTSQMRGTRMAVKCAVPGGG